ncbi:HAD-IIIA family hydrolase [Sneathiella marina]|uniref:D,D-heptose 1,7-bisphosphate phosphatase n=1 Tax=Sneathiella marina TaxID=2950108 RepID=A0ABY4W6Z9_9PROT|nr:HAD-IIIA family hydrolase [Sneathiella marina]USG61069.1 HAD-IIIA family hydrolase [Sneathiella marina]
MLILLDRDGVINEDRADFVKSPEELVFIPGSLEAIARLNNAGHLVAVVTNQSCIGRGIITEDQLTAIHSKLHDNLRAVKAHLDAIFVAPDAPWAATQMRKPGPGMMLKAMDRFRQASGETVLIGDSPGDMEAAFVAGCHRVLVQTGKGQRTQRAGLAPHLLPVSVARDLEQAVDYVLEERF